ncbi:glycosyltransferase family 2 protein [Candidatus Daviesbacteria bacterium]|nr:glycosyltransferase family 2 protein [Candidatus Daviesbacteria bacterium]
MRLLLSFFIGVIGFFYLGELYKRTFKKPPHPLPGLLLILSGFLVGFWGKGYFQKPLDIFIALFLLGAGVGLTAYRLLSSRYIISEKAEKGFIHRHETTLERFLEIIPGALTWIALTSPFWLSFTLPFALAYLLIIADVYWLISSVKTAILIYLGYKKLNWAKKQPWLEKLKKDFPNEWKDYYHLLVIPTYKENLKVLAPVFDAIVNSNYPKDKIFLGLGFEAWDDPQKIKEVKNYLKQVEKKIGGVLTTIHELQPGEVKGPGSNRNWMIKEALKEFAKRKIEIDKIFVTTMDADFVLHPEFLGGALHKYLSTPEEIRNKRTYTGSFLYYNNYWQAPAPMRMIAVGTAFWQLTEMLSSDKYRNFSSFSINLKSLLDIGLWMPDKVNDDSGFYWKAYYHFKGDYKVIPHFVPLNADTVLDESLFKTVINQYQQLKRWAYGVEFYPYIVKEYFRRSDIDFWDKTDKLFFALWGYWKWGTLALFVTFGGILIPILNPNYKQSVIAVNLPIISSWILTAAFLGLSATIFVHEKTVPPRPKEWGLLKRAWSYLQFLLVPIIVVTISSIPPIHAQTSLMFGRYLEFRVTRKARVEE